MLKKILLAFVAAAALSASTGSMAEQGNVSYGGWHLITVTPVFLINVHCTWQRIVKVDNKFSHFEYARTSGRFGCPRP